MGHPRQNLMAAMFREACICTPAGTTPEVPPVTVVVPLPTDTPYTPPGMRVPVNLPTGNPYRPQIPRPTFTPYRPQIPRPTYTPPVTIY